VFVIEEHLAVEAHFVSRMPPVSTAAVKPKPSDQHLAQLKQMTVVLMLIGCDLTVIAALRNHLTIRSK